MRNYLWPPVQNWIAHLIVQAIRKSVHNCSSNSGVKWTSCRRGDAATRQPAPTATRRLNCRLCRDGTERFRLYIALAPYRWLRSIRVKFCEKTKKCTGNLMVKEFWKSVGKQLKYERVNTKLWLLRFPHRPSPPQPATCYSSQASNCHIYYWIN